MSDLEYRNEAGDWTLPYIDEFQRAGQNLSARAVCISQLSIEAVIRNPLLVRVISESPNPTRVLKEAAKLSATVLIETLKSNPLNWLTFDIGRGELDEVLEISRKLIEES